MDKNEILSEKFRAIMSRGRRHRERDLYDMNFLLGKGAVPNRSEILKKFGEGGKRFSKEGLVEAIATIKPSWNGLVPFVSHTLQSYESVKESVMAKLKASGIL